MKKSDCLSAWQLDLLYYQGRQNSELSSLQQHVEQCETCNQQWQIRQQDAAELRAHKGFHALMQKGIESLKAPPQPAARSLWESLFSWQSLAVIPALATMAMVILFLPSPSAPLIDQTGKASGIVVRMLHFRKGLQYSQWTKDGESLHPGALVQFYYQLPRAQHLMIVSLDQKGAVSVFYPWGQSRSVHKDAGSGTLPPNRSLELDDNVGQERIFIITAARSFALASVKRALHQAFVRAGQDLTRLKSLPKPWHSQSILIRKQRERALLIIPFQTCHHDG